MDINRHLWRLSTVSMQLGVSPYPFDLGVILNGKAQIPPNTTFLSRTKEEGYELAALFLVKGLPFPVEIFDQASGMFTINEYLQGGRTLLLTWAPQEVNLIRRQGKPEIKAQFL